MLCVRKILLPFAFLTPFSAYGNDLIRESFDGKTAGTTLAGQAVEFSSEPQTWFEGTEPATAATRWTISNSDPFEGPNSVRVDSDGEITSSLEARASNTYPTFDPLSPTYLLTGALNVASGGSNVGYGVGLMSDRFLGGLYVLSTGEVSVLGGPSGGHMALSAPGVPLVVGLDTWHSLLVRLDFSDEQTATASFFIDGTAISFDGISPASYVRNAIRQPRTLYMESASADGTGAALGQAQFDSLRLQAVPEPSSLAAVGLGFVALLRRRRR